MRKQNFDAILIGSSPIMVCKAVELSRQGQNVALIEKDSNLGGAWKSAYIKGVGNIECHCHVIDAYGDNYKTIQNLLDIDFKIMKPQPITVNYHNGKQIRYVGTHKITYHILKTYSFLIKLYQRLKAKTIKQTISKDNDQNEDFELSVNIASNKSEDLQERVLINDKNPKRKLISLPSKRTCLYTLNIILSFITGTLKPIKEPIDEGYGCISEKIKNAICKNNISLLNTHANLIEKRQDEFANEHSYIIHLDNNAFAKAKNVYISQSADINFHKSIANLPTTNISKIQAKTLLIAIDKDNCRPCANYIEIYNNDLFIRISKCITKSLNKSYFLVQIKKEVKNIQEQICQLLSICGIAKSKTIRGGGG